VLWKGFGIFLNVVWPGELADSVFLGNGVGGIIYNFVNFLCLFFIEESRLLYKNLRI
jgi:hypothetical protein